MTGVNYENIERYLSGDMGSEERANFERELAQNKELADEMQFYEYVNISISKALIPSNDELQLRSELGKISQEIKTGEKYHFKPKKLPFYQRISDRVLNIITYTSSAAAVVILLLLWSPWKKSLVEQFTADNHMTAVVEQDSGNEATVQEAARLFNTAEYKEALPLFDQALEKQTDDSFLLFYRGLALLHTGELVSARNDMLRVYSSGSIFQHDAAFYIALTYAAAGISDDALRWLAHIPADALIFQKAEALKKKL